MVGYHFPARKNKGMGTNKNNHLVSNKRECKREFSVAHANTKIWFTPSQFPLVKLAVNLHPWRCGHYPSSQLWTIPGILTSLPASQPPHQHPYHRRACHCLDQGSQTHFLGVRGCAGARTRYLTLNWHNYYPVICMCHTNYPNPFGEIPYLLKTGHPDYTAMNHIFL